MAWVYGADKFLEDLRYMLGFYPYPRVFWLWAWKLLSPAIVLSILVFTALDYSGNTYAEYEYPAWANLGGWIKNHVIYHPTSRYVTNNRCLW